MSSPYLELVGPQFWWLWETLIFVMYIVTKIFGRMNKAEAIRMQDRGGSWFKQRTHYIDKSLEFFHPKKEESHTVEMDLSPMTDEEGIGGSRPMIFYNMVKGRPVILTIGTREIKHDPKNKKSPSSNPSSKSLYTLIKREIVRQMEAANTLAQHPQLMVSLILVVVGFLAGVVLGPEIAAGLSHPATASSGG